MPEQTEAIEIKKIDLKNGAFEDASLFELAQRAAKCLVTSTMVPEQYRGSNNLGNAIIALDISYRLGLSVMMVMQHLYVVHGKPAWSGQMVIALINASGHFNGPVGFAFLGEYGTDEWGCKVIARPKDSNEIISGPLVTIGMAKAEGWYDKAGSKWKTLPDLMLRYRAAAFFGRTTCPEVMLGMRTREEELEIGPPIEVKSKPSLDPTEHSGGEGHDRPEPEQT